MAEPAFLVIGGDIDTCRSLAATLPSDAAANVLLLGAPLDAVVGSSWPACVQEVAVDPGLDAGGPTDSLWSALEAVVRGVPVVVLDSSQASRDIAGWMVAHEERRIVWAVDAVHTLPDGSVECDRVVLGGSHRLIHTLEPDCRAVVLARPTGNEAAGAPCRPTIRVVSLRAGSSTVQVEPLDDHADSGPSLAAAPIVVSIGRGIGGPENVPVFRELADRLGGALGASRVVVDAGWVPFACQVGQTGKAVAPKVYLAFGISGALQHLAGMRGSATVVAVNTDPDAPLCRLADIVVEADAVTFAEALLKKIQEPERGGTT